MTSTADSGSGTLREAIIAAEGDGSSDTITFDAQAFSSAQTIQLDGALPPITTPIIISGPAASVTIRGEDTTDSYSLFTVAVSGNLSLDGLTLSHGGGTVCFGVQSCGGGIYIDGGTATVTHSTFSGNKTSNGFGGGIYNVSGALTVRNSTFSDNDGDGGAIHNLGGIVVVSDSTFSGNSAFISGGAVRNVNDGTVTIINSTFSGNNADLSGGAIANFGVMAITNSTVYGNTSGGALGGYGAGGILNSAATLNITNSTISGNSSALDGGGIGNVQSVLNVRNSIIAGNEQAGDPTNPKANCATDLTIDGDFNLYGWGTGCSIGANSIEVDPTRVFNTVLRNQLTNEGGATRILALRNGSPAINAGNNDFLSEANTGVDYNGANGTGDTLSQDQRGADRMIGGQVDIGAYEWKQGPSSGGDSDDSDDSDEPSSSQPSVPLCALVDGESNGIVRVNVPGGLNANVFCRVLVANGNYLRNTAEVGDMMLIEAGVIEAVDVFGFSTDGGQVALSQPVLVCLQGTGRLFYRDASNAPRVTVPLATTVDGGYTCGSIPNAGTVVLIP